MEEPILPSEVARALGHRSWEKRKENFLAHASEWGKKGMAKRWGNRKKA